MPTPTIDIEVKCPHCGDRYSVHDVKMRVSPHRSSRKCPYCHKEFMTEISFEATIKIAPLAWEEV